MNLEVLGQRIQGLRVERAMTLRDLADRSSVSVSMLSSVERGAKAPTVVVLDRIASGLDVPLARLVTEPDADRVVVRRAAEQDIVDEPGGWRRTILTPVVPGVSFEWVRMILPADCDAGTFPAYAAGSHEFIAVRSGTLTLTVADREFLLETGDSLYFAAHVPYGYANSGTVPCTYDVAALTPFSSADSVADRSVRKRGSLIMRPRRPGARARARGTAPEV
ncbi:MAG: cupin domain-containing protein [Nitriliruptorales bacterium]|nr:cupin domain-containing protein [Nitriliruptorales bacterium]